MPAYTAVAFAFKFFLSLGIALLLYYLVRKSAAAVLHNVIPIPEGTTFYLRALALSLLFIAGSVAITSVDAKPEFHFMQYVWAVTGSLADVFQETALTLLAYVALMTILIVVLKPRNEK
jgi:hypothetical protein